MRRFRSHIAVLEEYFRKCCIVDYCLSYVNKLGVDVSEVYTGSV